MAINTMDLGNCLYQDGLLEVKQFIETYNPGLFESMEVSQGGVPAALSCYSTDNKVCLNVYLAPSSDTGIHINFTVRTGGYAVSGQTISDYQALKDDRLSKIYSTSNGIMITGAHSSLSSADYRSSVIVSNEGEAGLCLTLMSRDGNGSNHNISKEGHIQFNTSSYIEHIVNDASTFTNQLMIVSARKTKTMLIPIVFASGYVSKNLFRMVYNENPESETMFTLGGTRYVSDGVFALKE